MPGGPEKGVRIKRAATTPFPATDRFLGFHPPTLTDEVAMAMTSDREVAALYMRWKVVAQAAVRQPGLWGRHTAEVLQRTGRVPGPPGWWRVFWLLGGITN